MDVDSVADGETSGVSKHKMNSLSKSSSGLSGITEFGKDAIGASSTTSNTNNLKTYSNTSGGTGDKCVIKSENDKEDVNSIAKSKLCNSTTSISSTSTISSSTITATSTNKQSSSSNNKNANNKNNINNTNLNDCDFNKIEDIKAVIKEEQGDLDVSVPIPAHAISKHPVCKNIQYIIYIY